MLSAIVVSLLIILGEDSVNTIVIDTSNVVVEDLPIEMNGAGCGIEFLEYVQLLGARVRACISVPPHRLLCLSSYPTPHIKHPHTQNLQRHQIYGGFYSQLIVGESFEEVANTTAGMASDLVESKMLSPSWLPCRVFF